jgi:uncharacterized protein (DUF1697 family)
MTTYIALLRGINVGPTTAVSMAELKESFEALGLEDVLTYIRSGNVVFRGNADAAAIERRVAADFGLEVPVVLRTPAELRAAVKRNPFPADDGKKLHVVFLDAKPKRTDALDPNRSPPDEFELVGREIYLYTPNGLGRSKLTIDWFEKQLGVRGTARNLNTVAKLIELAS